jgi:Protein of unknown function (DUF2917)
MTRFIIERNIPGANTLGRLPALVARQDVQDSTPSRHRFALDSGRAMRFKPREAGSLRVTQGRLWVTFAAPLRGQARRNGDHFIAAGACFDLRAGECAVLEPYNPAGAKTGARFDWEPAAVPPARTGFYRSLKAAAGWISTRLLFKIRMQAGLRRLYARSERRYP